ncbi:glutathione S-transferase family protein [Ignatzschineria rhizosphaerae]|uniref:Glutathione S-transferase family protein n=1 Tax=Ignatzschineria rhizosphaerae TaxID=2923279 RepID=A0ABY3X359_9GAMM|nr:glutathione S-transferase family protein [Ignatzschineria rhizosphaerae]UNM95452.1 glutathione S-transferase family protein [Ignatzschineria rhizosphaerae]
MSYQVVGYPLCPFVQRVLITLNEKAAGYEQIWLDPHAELPEWFKEWSPPGKVPVMKVSSGEVLFESMAIVEYIEEQHKVPSIYAKSATKRAIQRAWAGVAGDLYGPQYMSMAAKTKEEVDQYFDVMKETLQLLEGKCGASFFMGESLSAVDVVLAPMFIRFDVVASISGKNILDDFPKLQALSNKLLTHHSVLKIINDEWHQLFIDTQKMRGGLIFKDL